MARTVITDNFMSAELKYPNAENISKTMDVLDLPVGSAVRIYRTRIGALEEGAVKTARCLIARGDLEEVGA